MGYGLYMQTEVPGGGGWQGGGAIITNIKARSHIETELNYPVLRP